MLEAVVDASVVVKWFVEEEGSDKALEVRDRYVSGELKLIAPELLPFEVLNALYYKRPFTIEELKSVAEALDAFFFELHPLRGEYAELTLDPRDTQEHASLHRRREAEGEVDREALELRYATKVTSLRGLCMASHQS